MNLLFTRFILIPFKINVNLKILEIQGIFQDKEGTHGGSRLLCFLFFTNFKH